MKQSSHWDAYWAQGHHTSFGAEIDHTYEGALGTFWLDVISSLPKQARVLDLCSGNGALPLLFLNARSDLDILATDYASISEQELKQQVLKVVPKAKVTFQGRVNCEQLPFGNGEFDLVTSQFGIEYADLPSSLAEASRVTKQGGVFAAIFHHKQSRIIKQNSLTLAFLDKLEELELVSVMTKLNDARLTKSPSEQTLLSQLNDKLGTLYELSPVDFQELHLKALLANLFRQPNQQLAIELLNMFETEMSQYKNRLGELVGAAIDESILQDALEKDRVQIDATVQTKLLQDKEGLLGLGLIIT